MLAPDYICGLTVLGGEPFEPENQRVLVDFLRKVRRKYPEKKNISLRFRGSENQRLIDLNLTRECGTLTLWNE